MSGASTYGDDAPDQLRFIPVTEDAADLERVGRYIDEMSALSRDFDAVQAYGYPRLFLPESYRESHAPIVGVSVPVEVDGEECRLVTFRDGTKWLLPPASKKQPSGDHNESDPDAPSHPGPTPVSIPAPHKVIERGELAVIPWVRNALLRRVGSDSGPIITNDPQGEHIDGRATFDPATIAAAEEVIAQEVIPRLLADRQVRQQWMSDEQARELAGRLERVQEQRSIFGKVLRALGIEEPDAADN